MQNDNRTTVRRLYEDGINRGDDAIFEQLVAPDYVGVRGERGPAPFAAIIRELRTAFPDIRYTIDDLIAEGDRVAIRWSWTGTHRGPFRVIAATGRTVVSTGTAIYQLRGGQLVHAWLETDRLGFLQQLGVVPENPLPPPTTR